MFDTALFSRFPTVPVERIKSITPYIGIVIGVAGVVLSIQSVLFTPIVPPVQADTGSVCVTQPFHGNLVIYVSGAVVTPGIYSLSSTSRVADALNAAGGVTKNADPEYLQKELNLAQELQDTQHIYIPTYLDSVSTKPEITGNNLTAASKPTAALSSQKVSINTASKSELESLPKIGEKTAEKIIAGRPYTDLFQLVGRKVLSQSIYDEIETMLSL